MDWFVGQFPTHIGLSQSKWLGCDKYENLFVYGVTYSNGYFEIIAQSVFGENSNVLLHHSTYEGIIASVL